MSRDYVFLHEWDVDAPQAAVFEALADSTTYPTWWKPVYIEVTAEGEPAVGQVAQHHFKGPLPYTLRTESKIVRYEPPNLIETHVVGDLTGHGVWTLTPRDARVHVRFDWEVVADRPLLRYLTPVLRPVFRWNHDWSVKRAIEGLEPYAAGRG
jgi:uncharacterized protein YndB with AHSA1/START domain